MLHVLNAGHLNYAVGAGFARYVYTRIWRPTKDLDIYVKSQDLRYTLNLLSAAGFETEILEKHWLAKAWKEGYFIDLIFGTGHNQIVVDDDFLAGYKETEILGVSTRLVAVEELIAAAAYIKERKRYDSADTMHLILATKGKIDWQRVLNRLGKNRQLLLVDLLLFGYIYPGHTDYLPHGLIQELFTSTQQLWSEDNIDPKICRGSILDPFSFTVDIKDWGYKDQRNIRPLVNGEGESV